MLMNIIQDIEYECSSSEPAAKNLFSPIKIHYFSRLNRDEADEAEGLGKNDFNSLLQSSSFIDPEASAIQDSGSDRGIY